jgi:hypothetical protein
MKPLAGYLGLGAVAAVVAGTFLTLGGAGPKSVEDPGAYVALGPVWSMAVVTGTTATMLLADSSTTAAAIFAFEAPLLITSNQEGVACFTQDTGVSLGTAGAASATTITDGGGPDGPGACVGLIKGTQLVATPKYRAMEESIGFRMGVCTRHTKLRPGLISNLYPPCDAAADCWAWGTGGNTACTSPAGLGPGAGTRKDSGVGVILATTAAGFVIVSQLQ